MHTPDDAPEKTLTSMSHADRPTSRHANRRRRDEPAVRYGDKVWWNGELFVAESVERHGENWKISVVSPGDFERNRARVHFVDWREIDVR